MAKEMKDKTLDELAMEMYTKADSLPHLMAEAEITRRVTEAQLEAARATVETAIFTKRNANYMLASVIVALIAAFGSAASVCFTYLSTVPKK